MCGFAGVLALGAGQAVDPVRLLDMREAMRHRGPDGEGLWLAPDHRVGLAHRRLAIIDPAPESAQPMGNQAGTVQLVFNGEIYNHAALRLELTRCGHVFKTDHSDTEVLVHGYTQWGVDGLLQRLKGMFAIALWDSGRQQLFLLRDRLGIKPLYWTVSQGLLLFASEIKAILAHGGVRRVMNPVAMYHYLSGMVAPAPLTMFEGISKLPAAHGLVFGPGTAQRAFSYWDPLPRVRYAANDEAARLEATRALSERFQASVTEHLVSDVPVGVFLSGGVDSSSILGAMTRAGQQGVESFSVGFKDHEHLNELAQAREVARHFGSRHHEVQIGESDMRTSWDEILLSQDEPLADWVCIPLFHVSRLAAQHVKVCMVGEGADEPFAGYSGYQDFMRVHQTHWKTFTGLPTWLQSALAGGARRWASWHWDAAVGADFAARAAGDREVFWSGASTFWETQKQILMDCQALPAPEPAAYPAGLMAPGKGYDSYQVIAPWRAHLEQSGAGQDLLGRMIYYELKCRLPELLLMRVDKMTMAHALEARVPFLDHELIELAMQMPSAWKTRGGVGKAVLKDAVRGLIPDEVIDRPKRGFGAPMAEWLRGDWGHEVEARILGSGLFRAGWFRASVLRTLFARHRSGHRNHAHYIWVIFNLCAWHERFIESGAWT